LTADLKISAVHVGMLGTGEIAHSVAEFLKITKPPNVVLDPILTASSGASLLDDSGLAVLKQEVLSLATVITPNADEAAVLTGMAVRSVDQMKQAARRLHEMGAKAVVITGGHLEKAVDLLSLGAGENVQIFRGEKLDSQCTHGTGCAFSTSLACHLAEGRSLPEGVLLSKAYVTGAIANGYRLGKGTAPVNHMYGLKISEG
jgi:hydroxymethylpyrimidine/phosphomethylpyrimidine kinase